MHRKPEPSKKEKRLFSGKPAYTLCPGARLCAVAYKMPSFQLRDTSPLRSYIANRY
jgi:hypothetical protein